MFPQLGNGSDTAARILLVDQDSEARNRLAASLMGVMLPPPAWSTARHGREAVEMLRLATYDVLMLDLSSIADLGGEADLAVARLVRLAAGALVIALSDGASISASVAAMRAGAHDYLAKPVQATVLAARLAEMAARHGRSRMPEPAAAQPVAGPSSLIYAGADAVRPSVLPMWRQEQRIIEEAIATFAGNIAMAAAALELSPSTIYRKRQAWAEMADKFSAR